MRQAVLGEAQVQPRHRIAPGLAKSPALFNRQLALLRPASARKATDHVAPHHEFEGALVQNLEEYEVFEILLQADRNVALDFVEIQHRYLEQAWSNSRQSAGGRCRGQAPGNGPHRLYASCATRR